jgi:hypothetical protein
VTPDVGYGAHPLDASLTVTARGAVGALDWSADATYTTDHLGLTTTSDGTATLRRGARSRTAHLTCADEVRFASPRDYALGLVPP